MLAVAVELPLNLLHNITRCANLDKFFKVCVNWEPSLGKTETDKVNQTEVGQLVAGAGKAYDF